jgi:hypothetical protein
MMIAFTIVILVSSTIAKENVQQLEHDDNGGSEPIVKGTNNALCESGVSSGFACKNVELLTRLQLTDIVGSSDCSGGLHMVDIRNPKSPSFAGCFSADGYTHDVQCVTYTGPDQDHQAAEICFASNEDSLTIVDVSSKSTPVMLGKVDYPQEGYRHQGWLDEEQGMFYMGDEVDELRFGMNTRALMFDVGDLDHPVYAGAYQYRTSVIDHKMYVKGNYLYQANYLGGLRILRIDRGQSAGLTEVGYFDTQLDEDALDFDGAWNVYPFFDNGTILVSDISNGLFVLRASLEDDASETAPINGLISGLWTSEGLNDQGSSCLSVGMIPVRLSSLPGMCTWMENRSGWPATRILNTVLMKYLFLHKD